MGNQKIQIYWENVRKLSEEKGVSIAEARKIWKENKKSINLSAKYKTWIVQDNLEAACPYCKDNILQQEEAYSCACNTTYHAECMFEFKKCAIMGCKRPLSTSRSPVIFPEKQKVIIRNLKTKVTSKPVETSEESRFETGAEFLIETALSKSSLRSRIRRTTSSAFWKGVLCPLLIITLILWVLSFFSVYANALFLICAIYAIVGLFVECVDLLRS